MNKLRLLLVFFTVMFFSSPLTAQLTAWSAGLAFSSGIDYNTRTTGNPAIFGKAYIKINDRFHLVPSLAAFNKFKYSNFSEVLKTYMFHADADAVYSLYKDKSLRFLGFAGINATAIYSKWDILERTPSSRYLYNMSDVKPGLNLGGAFQLYVNDSFDAYISGKYVIGPFSQMVINVGGIYYVGGKRRRGMW